MKGLLMKDIHVFWRQMKIYVLLVLIFAAIPSSFQNTFAIFYAAMVPYSLFSVDEASKWDKLAAMMPYSTFELVVSKYLLGGLAVACSTAVVLVMNPIVSFALGASEATPLQIIFIAVCGAVLSMDITLPLIFRFGVEKGRITMLFLIVLVCGGAGALSALVGSGMSIGFSGGMLLFPLVTVLVTVISIKVSVGNYEKRER